MVSNIFRLFGISISFFFAALLAFAAMWGLGVAGYYAVPGHVAASWTGQGELLVVYATMAGFMADLIRFVAAIVWRGSARSALQSH